MKLTTFAVVDLDRQIILYHDYVEVEHPGEVRTPNGTVHLQVYDGWLGPHHSAEIAACLVDEWHPLSDPDRNRPVPTLRPLVDWRCATVPS